MRFKSLAGLTAGAALLALALPAAAQTAGPRYGSFGVDPTTLKTSVKPGDDFWTL